MKKSIYAIIIIMNMGLAYYVVASEYLKGAYNRFQGLFEEPNPAAASTRAQSSTGPRTTAASRPPAPSSSTGEQPVILLGSPGGGVARQAGEQREGQPRERETEGVAPYNLRREGGQPSPTRPVPVPTPKPAPSISMEEQQIFELKRLADKNKPIITNITLSFVYSDLKKTLESYFKDFYQTINNKSLKFDQIKATLRASYNATNAKIPHEMFGTGFFGSRLNPKAKAAWIRFGDDLLRLTLPTDQKALIIQITELIDTYKTKILDFAHFQWIFGTESSQWKESLEQFFKKIGELLDSDISDAQSLKNRIKALIYDNPGILLKQYSFGVLGYKAEEAWIEFYRKLRALIGLEDKGSMEYTPAQGRAKAEAAAQQLEKELALMEFHKKEEEREKKEREDKALREQTATKEYTFDH